MSVKEYQELFAGSLELIKSAKLRLAAHTLVLAAAKLSGDEMPGSLAEQGVLVSDFEGYCSAHRRLYRTLAWLHFFWPSR
jgi:hypothetical protein